MIYRCFIPIGSGEQYIYVIDKDEQGNISKNKLFGVRYVPLTDQKYYSSNYSYADTLH